MGEKYCVEDVLMLSQGLPFSFYEFYPRNDSKSRSTIADVLGVKNADEQQVINLLEAVDALEDNPHYSVSRKIVAGETPGGKGKTYAEQWYVTVSPA